MSYRDKHFKGKNILVTGTTKGLGREIFLEFQKLNANVIAVGRSDKLIEDLKKKSNKKSKNLFFTLDLFEKKNLDYLLKALKKVKNIDVIIHCIGGSFGINDPFSSSKDFLKCINGNLGIAIDINNHFLPNMIKKKKGNIIHIGSVVGHQATASVPYVTSKASISAYVRTMGNYLANQNVILSGISPGAFISRDNAMARFKFFKPKEYEKFLSDVPQKKMPKGSEYLDLLKILSSSDSKIFSGCMLSVDAGQGKYIV